MSRHETRRLQELIRFDAAVKFGHRTTIDVCIAAGINSDRLRVLVRNYPHICFDVMIKRSHDLYMSMRTSGFRKNQLSVIKTDFI
jgi:hypothetical protein